jgi:hypothetical protein
MAADTVIAACAAGSGYNAEIHRLSAFSPGPIAQLLQDEIQGVRAGFEITTRNAG